MANKIQFRRGLKANLPTLSVGEPAFTTDTNQFYIGNGTANIEYGKRTEIGDLTQLRTVNNTNLTVAINENTANISNVSRETNNISPSFGAFDFVARASSNDANWKNWFSGVGCSVVWDEQTQRYALIYCGAQSGGTTKFGIAYSDDCITWTDYASNPFFSNNQTVGQPDSGGVTFPQVYYENNQWYLFYIGFPNSGYESGEPKVCYATATSLLGTWTRHGAIITKEMFPSNANITVLYRPSIIKVGNTWYMFINAGSLVGVEDIWYFTSDSIDGTWTVGQKILNGSQFQGGTLVADPHILKFGERFIMTVHVTNGLYSAYCNSSEFPNTWHLGNALDIVGDPQRPVWALTTNGYLLFVNTDSNKYLDIYRPLINTNSQTYGMHSQAIINGNFDIWQRGSNFTNPVNGLYTSDRWRTLNIYFTPPTINISKQTLTSGDIPFSYNYLRINASGAGSNFNANGYAEHGIRQDIEFGTRYLCRDAKGVTISFYARSSIVNKKIGVYALQDYGTGGSPTAQEIVYGKIFTLTSNWKRYTTTLTTYTTVGKTFGTNNDDRFIIVIDEIWGVELAKFMNGTTQENYSGAGNIDIAQVMLNIGKTSNSFSPKSISEEMDNCKRYFQLRSTNSVNGYDLCPTMRRTPTISGSSSPYNYDAEMLP